MGFPHYSPMILHHGAACALLAPGAAHLGAVAGQIFFWLTVMLAVAGSVLSAFCIADPVLQPKLAPYAFIGQWFIWLATPLLWGIVSASQVLAWLKPFDLLAALVVLGTARWGAQAVCNLRWRGSSARRIPSIPYLPRAQRHS